MLDPQQERSPLEPAKNEETPERKERIALEITIATVIVLILGSVLALIVQAAAP